MAHLQLSSSVSGHSRFHSSASTFPLLSLTYKSAVCCSQAFRASLSAGAMGQHSIPVLSTEEKSRAAAEPQRGKKYEKSTLPDFFEVDRDVAAFDLVFESAQALKTARHYEVVFLVHEDHVEELQDIIQKVKDFIDEKKGKIFRVNDWGLRKLAYKIKKAKRANYILMNIQIGSEEINKFKSLLDKDERIIRHLVITKKRAETAETMSPPEFSSIRDEDDLDDDEEDDSEEEYEDSEDEDEEVEEAEEEKSSA